MRWTRRTGCRERRSRLLSARRREPRVEILEERTLLSLQAVSLADSALFGASADGGSDSPSISADGQLVAFESTADNLVDSPTGGLQRAGVRRRRGRRPGPARQRHRLRRRRERRFHRPGPQRRRPVRRLLQ